MTYHWKQDFSHKLEDLDLKISPRMTAKALQEIWLAAEIHKLPPHISASSQRASVLGFWKTNLHHYCSLTARPHSWYQKCAGCLAYSPLCALNVSSCLLSWIQPECFKWDGRCETHCATELPLFPVKLPISSSFPIIALWIFGLAVP